MIVAVTGATGFIGYHLCRQLGDAGHETRALVRSHSRALAGLRNVEQRVIGDLERLNDWPRALRGAHAAVHLAGHAHGRGSESSISVVNVEATLRAAQASAAHFVYVSTVKVHGETSGSRPLSEQAALNPRDRYAVSKARAEAALRSIPGLRLTVLRPPLVYGPGVKANFLALMGAIARGIPLPLAAVDNRRSLLYVGNLARCRHQLPGARASDRQHLPRRGRRGGFDSRACAEAIGVRWADRRGCFRFRRAARALPSSLTSLAGGRRRRDPPRARLAAAVLVRGRTARDGAVVSQSLECRRCWWRGPERCRSSSHSSPCACSLSRFGAFALDEPNARSLHERPVPRTGGIAVLLGAAVALGFGAAPLWLPMALALALAVVSFLDDLRGLPTALRLLSHVAAAGVLVWYVLSPMHPVEMAVLIAAIAWITNLYNFMDGSDGLAGGMAAIGFGAYALAAWLSGEAALASLCVALSAASAAFLLHNLHPARIFLGDVGSIPLGFLAGALGIVGWRNDALAALVPGAGVRAVHRRRDAHAHPAPRARRARLAGAPQPLLSAHGDDGARPSRHRVRRLRPDARLRRGGARRPQPGAVDAGARFPRHERAARRTGSLGRPALGALLARCRGRREAAHADRLRARPACRRAGLDGGILAALQLRCARRLPRR